MNNWFVYIIVCADDSLYTGITTDLKRRLKEHNSGKGAKYTRGRTPVTYLASVSVKNRSEATKLEYRVKQTKKSQKLDVLLKM